VVDSDVQAEVAGSSQIEKKKLMVEPLRDQDLQVLYDQNGHRGILHYHFNSSYVYKNAQELAEAEKLKQEGNQRYSEGDIDRAVVRSSDELMH
jgi:hypothetical protein